MFTVVAVGAWNLRGFPADGPLSFHRPALEAPLTANGLSRTGPRPPQPGVEGQPAIEGETEVMEHRVITMDHLEAAIDAWGRQDRTTADQRSDRGHGAYL